MEQKKAEKANIQSKKFIFLEIGLALTLLAIWGVFEFSTKVENTAVYNQLAFNGDDDLIEIPITNFEQPQPPAPPAPKIADIIEVTTDDDPVQDVPVDTEIGENAAVQITELPEISCPDEEELISDPIIFVVCEEMPKFKGNLLKYVAEHINYPEIAKDNDIQGTVYVGFVIDEKGKVSEVTILRGVNPLIDKEALKVVQNLPDWTPGRQSGKSVKVRMNMPIKFQLAN